MTDRIADRSEMESSAVSLNRRSWSEKEQEAEAQARQQQHNPSDSTPLLRKHNRTGATWDPGLGAGAGAYTGAVGEEASSSSISSISNKQSSYVIRTVFGEVSMMVL